MLERLSADGRRGTSSFSSVDDPADATGVRALARVNLAAIERNVTRLVGDLAPGVELCAVVKGDGYGHGAAQTARAVLAAGATRLAVSTAIEAAQLREAGIEAPVLVMGALSTSELDLALCSRAEVVAWDERFARAVAARGGGVVHLLLDTGMGTVGVRGPEETRALAAVVAATNGVTLAGVMTQFATADDAAPATLSEHLRRFECWARPLKAAQPSLVLHAANSPAALRDRDSHFDMVRVGDVIYGLDPFSEDPALRHLEPALELSTYVAAIRAVAAGESVGYSGRFVASAPTHVASLPIGYGDGVGRALTNNADVLLRGMRFPLVGTVAMDSVTVDVGSPPAAVVGDRVVLIGRQGDERITAEEIARRMGTVNAEVTCGLSSRVPRVYHRDGKLA